MKIMRFTLPVLAVVFASHSASAATSVWFIDGSNIVPNTVNMKLFVDGEGDDWTGAVLRMDLTSGTAYNNGSGGDAAPSSAFIGFVPELEFDTYVGIIDDATAGIAGGAGDLGGGPLSMDAPQISATWFNTDTNDTGHTQIASITLSPDASGTWQLITSFAGGQVLSGGELNNGAIGTGPIPNDPEPATLAVMGLGGLAVLRRR